MAQLNHRGGRLQIEIVQQTAFHIILGDQYSSYKSALKALRSETLFERRRKLCLMFANKSAKSPKFSKWFQPYVPETPLRNTKVQIQYQIHLHIAEVNYRDGEPQLLNTASCLFSFVFCIPYHLANKHHYYYSYISQA